MTRILGISPSDSSTNRDLNFAYLHIHVHIDTFTLLFHPTILFGDPEEQASWD